MSHPSSSPQRRLRRLLLVFVFGFAFGAVWRRTREGTEAAKAEAGPAASDVPAWASTPAPNSDGARPVRVPRLAVAVVLTGLFFAGASLSAVAGDQASALFDGDAAVAVAEETTVDTATTETATTETTETSVEEVLEVEPMRAAAALPAPVEEVEAEPAAEPVAEAAPAPEPEPEPAPAPAPEAPTESEEPLHAHGAPAANVPAPAPPAVRVHARKPAAKAPDVERPQPVVQPAVAAPQPLDPEAIEPGSVATIWLNRTLVDPTPPTLRLSPAVAKRLVRESKRAGARWELVLGVLRADGGRASLPARGRTIAETAETVADVGLGRRGWTAALAATGRTAAADRALALARYYRAVGVETLVEGLLARQEELAEQVVADERIWLYAGGREDIAAGHVDVRVLALIAYLAESYGQVTISSLITGHRLYSRPGVVSRHIYGQAVDIAALGDLTITGNQEPGGLTEKAVRDILLLPEEVRPQQVISLLGLGGPSFPLADHDDHIHVGY